MLEPSLSRIQELGRMPQQLGLWGLWSLAVGIFCRLPQVSRKKAGLGGPLVLRGFERMRDIAVVRNFWNVYR